MCKVDGQWGVGGQGLSFLTLCLSPTSRFSPFQRDPSPLPHACSYAAPAQLLIVYHHYRANAALCAGPALTPPASAAVTRQIATALDLLHLGPGLAVLEDAPTPVQECRTVLAWQQLCFSFFAPLLAAAVLETKLWLRHAEQRARRGLPPERGFQPRLYLAVKHWLLDLDWPHAVLLAWMFASTLHMVAAALARNVHPLL